MMARQSVAFSDYCRVSTPDQTRGYSPEEQERRIRGRALEEGWTVHQIFVENGVSGSVPLAERPEGGHLVTLLQPGDIVVAAKLDRMFRSARDAHNVIHDFQSRKIALWLLDIGGNVLGDGIAKLMMSIVSAFAEFERDRLKERIADSQAYRLANGIPLSNRPRYGFRILGKGKDARSEEDETEQRGLALMRDLYRRLGPKWTEIAREVARQGYRPAT